MSNSLAKIGRRAWTKSELNYLKENWQRDDVELSAYLGRSIGTIRTKRTALGLIGKNGRRQTDWTQEEVERLTDLWGSKTIPQIAKLMGRTQNAIAVKSKRLGLGAFKDHSEYMPALQVANFLGIDIHSITDYWIPKLGLPFKHVAPRGNRKFTYIQFSDLMKWLKKNPDKWDSRRVELYALGSEPEWLKQKRKSDSMAKPKGCVKWTPQEDARLVNLYRQGVKIKDIAAELGRSYSGVEHRVARLDIWGTGAYIGNRHQLHNAGVQARVQEQEALNV